MKLLLCLTLVAAANALPSADIYPLSDEFINTINSLQSTWIAGRNFPINTTMEQLRALAGARLRPTKILPTKQYDVSASDTIPESFDAREQWPDCPSISEIRDQGSCGSCWAFAAVEAMSDRICIHSKGEKKVKVSAQDLVTCCADCGDGCDGGYVDTPWTYWADTGIVTGGQYGETDGCRAYSLEPCAHYGNDSDRAKCTDNVETPACVKECDSSSLTYKEELTFGRSDAIYDVSYNETLIKLEIMTNGPVEAYLLLFQDFYTYKSRVYKHVSGGYLGGHAVKLLGWGEENDTPYWLAANSFNTDWGEDGYFKILRGRNHVKIESQVIAGLPKL